MKTVYAGDTIINLGYEGEDNAREVVFSIPCDWQATTENTRLLFLKPNADKATEYAITIENNLAKFTLHDSATVAGYGKMQLILVDSYNEIIKKSQIYTTVCKKSLEKAGN